MTTVVLGWDALDHELLDEFNLASDFGADVQAIETYDNPVAGEPLTREVWPSIITGEMPDRHGIHAVSQGDGIEWDNPLLDIVSSATQSIIPHQIRTRIGAALRDRGQEVKQYDADYYRDRGVGTVFDDVDARAISVPNYRVERDEEVGVGTDRTSIWTDVIETVEVDGETAYRPLVSVDEIEEHLLGKAHKRLGLVNAALQQDYDLIFVWFGYLDTVGHLDPMVDDPNWQRRHYDIAARMTARLRRRLGGDSDLLCVSDHGLQDGGHTHNATLAGRDLPAVDSVLDVREVIEARTDRASSESGDGWDASATEDVEDSLEALGYV